MTVETTPISPTIPFYLKYLQKPKKQSIVNSMAFVSLLIVGLILIALGIFQFFYAERASQYFGLTEYEYLHFLNMTFTQAQLPAFGVAGGLVLISLINAFRYEAYYSKNSRYRITRDENPFLFQVNRFLPVEWLLTSIRSFAGYRPNDVTWTFKLLFAFIEGYFIYVALSVEKASNPIVHQLGLLVAIGLPILSYCASHGFAWLFFYVFDYNNYRSKLLNDDNAELEKKNTLIKENIETLESQKKELEDAIVKAKSKLDDSIEDLSRTDDEVDRLKTQKTDLLQQIGSIVNGDHPLELENQIRQLREENAHLKEVIEMNLNYIETALSNTRDKIGITNNSLDTSEKYSIKDTTYLEAEREMANAGFAPSSHRGRR